MTLMEQGFGLDRSTGPSATKTDLDTLFDRLMSTLRLFDDASGRPLWLGRTRRHATVAQFLALAVRDGGCVRCGASVQRCAAHHVVPWNAPAKGTTDIDSLALQCGPCHRELHQQNLTLYRRTAPNGRTLWQTRPATPEETPPPRPQTIQRE